MADRIDGFDEREPNHDDEPSLAGTEGGDSFSGGGIADDGEEELATATVNGQISAP